MAWHPFIEYGNCSPRFSWNLSYCGTQRWLPNHTLFKFLTSVHIDADSKERQRDIIKQATCWVGCSYRVATQLYSTTDTCMKVKKCMLWSPSSSGSSHLFSHFMYQKAERSPGTRLLLPIVAMYVWWVHAYIAIVSYPDPPPKKKGVSGIWVWGVWVRD